MISNGSEASAAIARGLIVGHACESRCCARRCAINRRMWSLDYRYAEEQDLSDRFDRKSIVVLKRRSRVCLSDIEK
jgi:hypothetical protein